MIFSFLPLIIVLLCTSCARKRGDVFSFDFKPIEKVSTLLFPAVRGLTVAEGNDHYLIEWNSIKEADLPPLASLVGYHIYRLNQRGFIPHSPCGKTAPDLTRFVDYKKGSTPATPCYMVVGVFLFKDMRKEGPGSLIIKSQPLK